MLTKLVLEEKPIICALKPTKLIEMFILTNNHVLNLHCALINVSILILVLLHGPGLIHRLKKKCSVYVDAVLIHFIKLSPDKRHPVNIGVFLICLERAPAL